MDRNIVRYLARRISRAHINEAIDFLRSLAQPEPTAEFEIQSPLEQYHGLDPWAAASAGEQTHLISVIDRLADEDLWTASQYLYHLSLLTSDDLARAWCHAQEEKSACRNIMRYLACLISNAHLNEAVTFACFLAHMRPTAELGKILSALEQNDPFVGSDYSKPRETHEYHGLDPWAADIAEAQAHLLSVIDLLADEDLWAAHRYFEYLASCTSSDLEVRLERCGEKEENRVSRDIVRDLALRIRNTYIIGESIQFLYSLTGRGELDDDFIQILLILKDMTGDSRVRLDADEFETNAFEVQAYLLQLIGRLHENDLVVAYRYIGYLLNGHSGADAPDKRKARDLSNK
jgi:hypothetical protein